MLTYNCWLTFLLQWGQQISMGAEESTNDRFPSFPCIKDTKSSFCDICWKWISYPIWKWHGVGSPPVAVDWPLCMATQPSPGLARQLQIFMSQLLKNSCRWKCSKQHRVFMTPTPGLSWHPVLAAASCLVSVASVLFRAISSQCLLEVCTHSPQISTRTNQLLEGSRAHSYFGISHTQAEPWIKYLVLRTKTIQLVM